jgi:enolase-phosphatase E1
VTAEVAAQNVSAILLDVEGTTTPVAFVHRTLFSFARQHMKPFLEQHWEEEPIRVEIAELKNQHVRDRARGIPLPDWNAASASAERSAALAYMSWLMDHDMKCTPLKLLQGRIWQEGYRSSELRAEVFPDVPAALRRWSRQNRSVLIFSSGSILAQRLLFENTTCGDLSRFLLRYFDTTTGSKVHFASYTKISAALSRSPGSILFISDTPGELDAASEAGMQTAWCVRNDGTDLPTSRHRAVRTLDQVFPEQTSTGTGQS